MRRFDVGDKVRIDIPDSSDPDYSLHGCERTIVEILEDDAGKQTGDVRDSYLFGVELDGGSVKNLRWQDLRPVSDQ